MFNNKTNALPVQKYVLFLLLCALIFCGTLTGCNSSAVAKSDDYSTLEPPDLTIGELSIISLDNQNPTDEITYSVQLSTKGNENRIIYESISTENGTATVELTKGDYILTSSGTPSINVPFKISEYSLRASFTIQNNPFKLKLANAKNVCMVGDSITIGSRTNGHGWHENLLSSYSNIEQIHVAAKGGQTSASILENEDNLNTIRTCGADTFIIALGVNDYVKHISDPTFPTSSNTYEYTQNLETLVNIIREAPNGKDAEIIFIASFAYVNKAENNLAKYLQRDNAHQLYMNAINNWCKEKGYLCITPMNTIYEKLSSAENQAEYISDDLHPTYPAGTDLYSSAVGESSTLEETGSLVIFQSFYNDTTSDFTSSTTYSPAEKNTDIHRATYFAIRNVNTNKYLAFEQDEESDITGIYTYKSEAQSPSYYRVGSENLTMKIERLPQGCYEVVFKMNTIGYSPLRQSTIMYVTPGNTPTYARLFMNADITASLPEAQQ